MKLLCPLFGLLSGLVLSACATVPHTPSPSRADLFDDNVYRLESAATASTLTTSAPAAIRDDRVEMYSSMGPITSDMVR